jgi:hypothetical protein
VNTKKEVLPLRSEMTIEQQEIFYLRALVIDQAQQIIYLEQLVVMQSDQLSEHAARISGSRAITTNNA